MAVVVRPARAGDGPILQQIDRLAGARFRDVGMPAVADDEPPSAEVLDGYLASGRSWVAVDEVDGPIGFVLVDVIDGDAHVEQLSVRPDRQGTGAGRALLDRVAAWAVGNRLPGVTLTTFTHVPWNRPLFEHLGFRVLDDPEIGPGLRAVRLAEGERGLEPRLRVCMRRDGSPAAQGRVATTSAVRSRSTTVKSPPLP